MSMIIKHDFAVKLQASRATSNIYRDDRHAINFMYETRHISWLGWNIWRTLYPRPLYCDDILQEGHLFDAPSEVRAACANVIVDGLSGWDGCRRLRRLASAARRQAIVKRCRSVTAYKKCSIALCLRNCPQALHPLAVNAPGHDSPMHEANDRRQGIHFQAIYLEMMLARPQRRSSALERKWKCFGRQMHGHENHLSAQ